MTVRNREELKGLFEAGDKLTQQSFEDLLDSVRMVTEQLSVKGEIPFGVINGSNPTFLTQYSFIPESVEVFINGVRQRVVAHYLTMGVNRIDLADSPIVGDTVLVNYIRG